METASNINYHQKDQSALTNVQEQLSGAESSSVTWIAFPSPRRTQTRRAVSSSTNRLCSTPWNPPPSWIGRGKDQTGWLKEMVSNFRARVTGDVMKNAALATRDVELGKQSVQKTRLVEGTKRTEILSKPTVYDPATQAVIFPPAR